MGVVYTILMLTPNELLVVLPFAFAAAVSPLLFTFALLVATQKKQSLLKSSLFLLGSLIAISIIGLVIFFALAEVSPSTTYTTSDAYIDLAIGLLLVVFAARQFVVKKPKKQKTNKNISSVEAFGLGLGFMMANSSTIIMFLPAAHLASYYSTAVKLELLAIMIVFSLIPAIVPPVMLRLIESQKIIESIKNFVNEKGRYIIAGVFGVLGIIEIVKALKGLF